MSETRAPERPFPSLLLGDVLWRRLDPPGFEHCRVLRVDAGPGMHAISGCVLTVDAGAPLRVDYLVQCDLEWSTRAVYVTTLRGSLSRRLELRRDEAGAWWRGDDRLPELDGLVDIDLSITPATNTLPIRRLGLEVGGEGAADAAWIRFPELALERLPQRYSRTAERRYRYESGGGSFTADLEVDDQGIVVRYGDVWERIAP